MSKSANRSFDGERSSLHGNVDDWCALSSGIIDQPCRIVHPIIHLSYRVATTIDPYQDRQFLRSCCSSWSIDSESQAIFGYIGHLGEDIDTKYWDFLLWTSGSLDESIDIRPGSIGGRFWMGKAIGAAVLWPKRMLRKDSVLSAEMPSKININIKWASLACRLP
jgi:hypothetical protein